jgi:phosphoribosylaminoimidazole-succinocarboxamide synthase
VLRVEFHDTIHGAGRQRVVAGTGRLREQFCFWFYRLLEREGIQTHLARRWNGAEIGRSGALLARGLLVTRLQMVPLELLCRYVTRGHWVDAHKFPVFVGGIRLNDPVFEMCLKWRQAVQELQYVRLSPWQRHLHAVLRKTSLRGMLLPETQLRDDPRINADLAVALHQHAASPKLRGRLLQTREEADQLRSLTLRVNDLLAEFLGSQGWILEDGKFEVGVSERGERREFIVADEYSQDSARIRDRRGHSLSKDLHRSMKPDAEIYDGYARLADAMRTYAR